MQFKAGSPSDKGPHLKFQDEESAKRHCDRMNSLLDNFETSDSWNKTYWKEKPQPWEVTCD